MRCRSGLRRGPWGAKKNGGEAAPLYSEPRRRRSTELQNKGCSIRFAGVRYPALLVTERLPEQTSRLGSAVDVVGTGVDEHSGRNMTSIQVHGHIIGI